jgi:hypothetical protein
VSSAGSIGSTNSEAARIDDYSGLEGDLADVARRRGIRPAVGVPIVVAGRLWGVMAVSSKEHDPLPQGTEARLADFTELVATAIANAESREALEQLADEQAALRRVATLVARRACGPSRSSRPSARRSVDCSARTRPRSSGSSTTGRRSSSSA